MRERNLKPWLFENPALVSLDAGTRVLFVGLLCLADREGRLEDNPDHIHVQVHPYDDAFDTNQMLQALADIGALVRYDENGARHIEIVDFLRYHSPHPYEASSVIPPPP